MALPTSAQTLLNSPYEGTSDFFLLCHVDEANQSNPLITIAPDSPIAVNGDELRDEIYAEQGVKLPTRYEVTNGQLPDDLTHTDIDWENIRTAATGMALWLQSSQLHEPLLYLVQNDATKKVNPNRWNFPSNLLREGLFKQAWSAANSETALLIPSTDGKSLRGIIFDLPTELGTISTADKIARLNSFTTEKEGNIRKQLAEQHPEHIGLPIHWHNVATKIRSNTLTQPVTIDILGQRLETRAHVLNDANARSVNIHFDVEVAIDSLPFAQFLDLTRAFATDGESYGRNHGLHTLEQARKLDTIPAPCDYLSRHA